MKRMFFRFCLSGGLLLCAAAGALAAPAPTKEDEFFREYAIPTLVEQELDQRIRMTIFQAFVQQFREPPPRDALGEKDLAKTLAALDKLARDAAKRIGFSLRGQEWRVKELFFRPGPGAFALPEGAPAGPATAGAPAAPAAASAASDFLREVAATARLPAYQEVLNLFVPQQLQQASRAYVRAHARDMIERGDENFSVQRELLRVLAESPALLRVLPNAQEVPALHELALRNRERVRANPALIPRGIEQAVGLTAQAVINDRSFGFSTETLDAYREQVATLKGRVDALTDASRTPACRDQPLDLATVAASGGDAAKVRTKAGQPIVPGSPEHAEMSTVYRLGCAGQRDIALARKVMEEVAAAPARADGPGFAGPPDDKYCGLAQWKRLGIGGPRDEAGARDLEQRFVRQNRVSCKTTTTVHPTDPWGDSN